MHKVFGIRFISCQAVEKRPSVPRLAGLSGRLTVSAACLHAVVLAFICLRVYALSGELGAPHKRRCFGTQAWEGVAPYSSRRPPAASPSRRRGKNHSLLVAMPPLGFNRSLLNRSEEVNGKLNAPNK